MDIKLLYNQPETKAILSEVFLSHLSSQQPPRMVHFPRVWPNTEAIQLGGSDGCWPSCPVGMSSWYCAQGGMNGQTVCSHGDPSAEQSLDCTHKPAHVLILNSYNLYNNLWI